MAKPKTTPETRTRPPRGPAPKTDEPGVLFLRDVPADVLQGLEEWANELRAANMLHSGLSRSKLAVIVLANAVKNHKPGETP